jgi:hypothetical protein
MRKDHRDGMPAPLVLAGARGIVVAIEDNGWVANDRFKPVIVRTSPQNNWMSGAVSGEDKEHRHAALAEPLPELWYGGAPFLRQLPSGVTLLSYQQSEDGTLSNTRMVVCVGDRDARGFTHESYPFAGAQRGQLWGSLFVKDGRHLTAITSTRVGDVPGLWAIDGNIIDAK